MSSGFRVVVELRAITMPEATRLLNQAAEAGWLEKADAIRIAEDDWFAMTDGSVLSGFPDRFWGLPLEVTPKDSS